MNRRSSSQKDNEQAAQINVYMRIRPLKHQFSKKSLKVIDKGVALHYKQKIHQFYFDGVFDDTHAQQGIFQGSCLPIVNDVMNGNNACLFVYGQTGTGKTYTMGTLQAIKRQDQGLIPLSLNYLLNTLSKSKKKDQYSISISFMQIYMEDIYDLFNPSNGKLSIRESIEQSQTFVEDLVIVPIQNYKQSIQLINAGLKYRKVGNQKMNQLSSRSHTIFTIYVTQKISSTEYISSTLSLIDLAGSERVKKSNSVDLRLDQAKFINTSLSSLGNVISALAENNTQKFVPYRSSKLTRILKDSLTGRSKISVICTLQISDENIYETYSTLLFADRCKSIRFANQPVINIETFQDLQSQKDLKQALEKSVQKQKQYQEIIKSLESGGSRVVSRDPQRENELSQIIQSIYKLFGQINSHLKKLLDPQKKNSIVKQQAPKVTSASTGASIKQNMTQYAQETIEHINNLSSIAFGDIKYQSQSSNMKLQTETLTSILLDLLRQNIKLYQNLLLKQSKDSFEKEICLDEYEKEKKQQILNKLKSKKLKNLQNNLQQIWSQNHNFSNPLTSLLNGIRKGQIGLYNQKNQSLIKPQVEKDFSNPKQFLKMLTRQQSERKHQEMLIDEGNQQQKEDLQQKKSQESSLKGSKITYFQKSSPKKLVQTKPPEQPKKKQQKFDNSSNEIKKLLDSLIASKVQFQQKRRES